MLPIEERLLLPNLRARLDRNLHKARRILVEERRTASITEVIAHHMIAIFHIFPVITIAYDIRADHDGDRTKNDVGTSSNKLKVESVRRPISDKLDVERSRHTSSDIQSSSRMIDQVDAGVRSSYFNIDRNIGDRILDSIGDTIGNAGSKA